MKTTLFLINAALCFSIGVSFASEPFLEEINKNQIIPRLDSLALSSYASTNKTNNMAVRAYKNENKIDEKLTLIHCPSSTEMIEILGLLNLHRDKGNHKFKDPRTGMEWYIIGDDSIGTLSGCDFVRINLSKDQLVCRYEKNFTRLSWLSCERPIKTSKSSLILNSWAPLNPDYQRTLIKDRSTRFSGDEIILEVPVLGVDLVCNQAQ